MNDLIGFLKELGVSKIIIYGLTISVILYGLISGIVKFIHWAILRNNQWLLNENLRPYFSNNDVDRATRYYIPTKFQNVSPLADDEPGKSHLASAKELLMPMFLNKAFKNKIDNTKYYLILADAGMGKTTFLINLFLSHTSRPIKNLFGVNENQGMKLFPLGSPDIWKDIEKIENKRDTILLLDAFDEDVKAVDDYDARMKEILEATKEFKEIVITCRTQFFPSDKEIPDDTGYTTFGGEQETYKFQRVYLSVFDETDIKRYLNKRFSFLRRSKRKRAFEIVKKSPNLVMRPMLLSYINDFVEANRTFKYSYEIYEVLIDKWIERESKKHGIRKKYGSEEKYRELLLNFSQALAINLYEKSDERGGYFITKDDFIKGTDGFQITEVVDYGMTETEIRSKSLLNRNAEGKYKFSHKSILEYFLARELIQNGKFLSNFDFDGMDAAEMFLDEMLEPLRNLEGTYTITIDTGFQNGVSASIFKLKDLMANHLNKIRQMEIKKIGNFDLLNLSHLTNFQMLVVFDNQKYALLYDLYWYVHCLKLLELRGRLELRELVELRELIELPERLELRELPERLELIGRLEQLELLELIELLGMRELQGLPERLEQLKRIERLELREWREWLKRREVLELRERLRRLLKNDDHENKKTLQPIEDFLKDMKLLQEKLPNCKMIY